VGVGEEQFDQGRDLIARLVVTLLEEDLDQLLLVVLHPADLNEL
jgi:hypothetical protein